MHSFDNPALATNVISPGAHKSTLFLGDLSAFCTEQDILQAFSVFGEVIDIKIMRSEDSVRNLSYGFLKFASPVAAKKALNAMNGVLFCGRNLRLGWACYKSKKDKHVQHHDRMDSSSIHVSYITHQLDRVVTEESLRVLFSKFGNVIDASIKKKSFVDERQCGYGFVHFSSSTEGMQSALCAVAALNDKVLENISFKCSLSHNLERQMLDQQRQHNSFLSMDNNYPAAPQQQHQRVQAFVGTPFNSSPSIINTPHLPHPHRSAANPSLGTVRQSMHNTSSGVSSLSLLPPSFASASPRNYNELSHFNNDHNQLDFQPFASHSHSRSSGSSLFDINSFSGSSSSSSSSMQSPSFSTFTDVSSKEPFFDNYSNNHIHRAQISFPDDLFSFPSLSSVNQSKWSQQPFNPVNALHIPDERDSLDSNSDSSPSPRLSFTAKFGTPF